MFAPPPAAAQSQRGGSMIARMGNGWQTVLADLSLILFMVTATALADQPVPPAAPVRLPAEGEPVAIWRATADGPSLSAWLAAQPADPRQRLTLVGAPGDSPAVLAEASRLPRPARIVIEPALTGPPYAALTFDTGEQP